MVLLILFLAILIIVINILFIKYKNKLEELDLLDKKINDSITSITIAVEKKEDYLEKTIDIIKNSNKRKYGKKNILENLIKNKNKKLSLEERILELKDNLKEFNEILEDDKKLNDEKKLNEIIYDININENNLKSSIDFYNNSINEYNKKKKGFLANIICNKKDYKDYNQIIIIKEEEFEILKEGK